MIGIFSFPIKNIFYDKVDLRLFLFSCNDIEILNENVNYFGHVNVRLICRFSSFFFPWIFLYWVCMTPGGSKLKSLTENVNDSLAINTIVYWCLKNGKELTLRPERFNDILSHVKSFWVTYWKQLLFPVIYFLKIHLLSNFQSHCYIFPCDINLFKISNGNTRTMFEIFSKLPINININSVAFIVNFEHISQTPQFPLSLNK